MEVSPYMIAITDARSMDVAPEDAGHTTISAETQEDLTSAGLRTYMESHPDQFIRALRSLESDDQVSVLSWYILHRVQGDIGKIVGESQTQVSQRIRICTRALCSFLTWGVPDITTMRRVMTKAGVERMKVQEVEISMAEAIDLYRRSQSFERVANILQVHRAGLRRALRAASYQMVGMVGTRISDDPMDAEVGMLGAYIYLMLDKGNPIGTGKKQTRRETDVHYRIDPPCVGEFRIRLDDPGIDSIFVPSANN